MRAQLESLPPEILIEVFDFLSPNDFARATSGTSKRGPLRNPNLTKHTWLKLLSQKWSLSDIETKTVVESLSGKHLGSAFSLRELYPLAHPIALDVFSNEAVGLKCSKNTAAFLGFVGAGNQSVQTLTPFPALSTLAHDTWIGLLEECARTIFDKMKLMAPSILYPRCRTINSRESHSVPARKQNLFCTPFAYDNNGTSSSFILPRFIAYYEVHLTKRAKCMDPSNPFYNPFEEQSPSTECVAVGLATKAFELKRLPGWDNDSYGYHGDDGAIFHGRGRQLATYGPSFGAGDTVGCGVDYESRSIFFTLNGKYHGTAFGGVDLADGQVLYPTVGIDAAVSVTFNFGREKFKFDLHSYIAKRENDTRMLQQHPVKSTLHRNVSRVFI